MKLKKKYIIIIFIILLVAISAFIYKGKSVSISTKREEKLAKYEFQKKDEYECNSWINTSIIASSDIIFRDGNYLIINAENTNLITDEGPTGYEGFAFIKNGCAWEENDFFDDYKNNNNLCSSMKDYVNNRDQTNEYNWNHWAESYNKYVEENLCTGSKIDEIEEPATPVETHTCKEELDENGWPALRYDGYVNYGFPEAAYSTESEWVNFYIDECGCNENYKYYIKTNDAKNTLKNKCGYSLEESGYHTHSVNGQNFCFKDGVWNSKGTCSFECTNEYRTQIINNNNVSDAKIFNNSCTSLEEIPLSTITIEFNGGWGPATLGSNWGGGNGTYTIEGIVGNTHTIEFDNDLIYYNYSLDGWSKNQTCTSYDSSVINPKTKNPKFTFTSSDQTFYACYEGGMFEESLFESDGSKKTGTTYHVYEDNKCQDETELESILSNVPMKQTSRYVKESYETIKTNTVVGGKENSYCNVLCVDTVNVSYPNIFETIPAGQYFELMYEPEIKATRTCQSEFRYNAWKTAYTNAINNEKQKMTELKKAQANYDAANSLSTSGTKGTCCEEGTCTGYRCEPPCEEYNYSDSKIGSYYADNLSRLENGDTQSATGCGSSAYENSRNTTIENASTALETAKTNYKNAVTERISLEQMNLQCYTILDQDNNSTQKNEDVFNENYIYKDENGEELVDVNEIEYSIKTPLVSTVTENNSTKSTYANYVTSNTTYSTNDLQKTGIKKIGSTANYFTIYPSLTFKYDDGSVGKPSDVNQEQVLNVEAHVKLDTGSYTTLDGDNYSKNSNQETFTGNFYYNGSYGTYINFNAYTSTKNLRKVEYYFTYHEAQEYMSELQSGITKKKTGTLLSNYMELNNKQIVTVGTSNQKKYIYNNVLPVSLKAIGSKNYKVEFELSDKSSSSLKGTTGTNYLKLSSFAEFTGHYTCNYEITNDALVSSDLTSADYKKLKSNTIFRSVKTDEIDPNDRTSTGKLGENWTNAKGSAVKNLIKTKETNGGLGSKYTYTDDNLEYSFTLTPTLIQKIKDYNKTTNYDDFNLTCATEDGRECVSEFLTNLSKGKIDGYVYSNYSSINSWGFDDLVKIRKKWKYYNGTDIEIKTAPVDSSGKISNAAMTLDEYVSNYEKWGVLP